MIEFTVTFTYTYSHATQCRDVLAYDMRDASDVIMQWWPDAHVSHVAAPPGAEGVCVNPLIIALRVIHRLLQF